VIDYAALLADRSKRKPQLCVTHKIRKLTTMNKIFLSSAIALVLLTGSAFAKSEIDVKRTIWEISDFPELEKSAKAICAGKMVLSIKLQNACKGTNWPSVTKAGKFRNVGIGAELNALIAQTVTEKAQ